MPSTGPLLQVVAGAVLISFAPVWVKLVPVGPTVSAFYRMAFGGLVLLGLATLRRGSFRAAPPAVVLAVLAGGLFAVDLICWHRSVLYVGPGLATILGNFQVFVLAGYGMLVLREPATWRLLVAIPLAVVGLALLVGVEWGALPADDRLGVVFGLLTAASYGAYLLLLRRTQAIPGRLGSVPNLAVISVVAVLGLGVSAGLEGESLAIPDPGTGALLVTYGVTAQVAGWILISRGLPHIEASRAGLVLLLQPALAFVWDVLFFSRPTTPRHVVGALLALGAIYLGMMARRRPGEVPSVGA